MKTKFSLFLSLFTVVFIVFSCIENEIGSSSDTDIMVGNWQMVTSRVVIKVNDNGKIVSLDEKRDGTSTDVINIKNEELILDLNDVFKTKTYKWDYAIKGNELELSGNIDDFSYFTFKMDGNKMTWTMNTEQTKRSLNATVGNNSILNTNASNRDNIIENMFTIEWVKK